MVVLLSSYVNVALLNGKPIESRKLQIKCVFIIPLYKACISDPLECSDTCDCFLKSQSMITPFILWKLELTDILSWRSQDNSLS